MVPYGVVHAKAHKPAEQQVVVDLLDQQPLRTHGVEHLQQKRPQDVLRCNRWAAGVGIESMNSGLNVCNTQSVNLRTARNG